MQVILARGAKNFPIRFFFSPLRAEQRLTQGRVLIE